MSRRRVHYDPTAPIIKSALILTAIVVAAFMLGGLPNFDIAKATGFGSALKTKD